MARQRADISHWGKKKRFEDIRSDCKSNSPGIFQIDLICLFTSWSWLFVWCILAFATWCGGWRIDCFVFRRKKFAKCTKLSFSRINRAEIHSKRLDHSRLNALVDSKLRTNFELSNSVAKISIRLNSFPSKQPSIAVHRQNFWTEATDFWVEWAGQLEIMRTKIDNEIFEKNEMDINLCLFDVFAHCCFIKLLMLK